MDDNIAKTASLIDAMLNNRDSFKTEFNQIVSQKINDALENKKREISASLIVGNTVTEATCDNDKSAPFGARKLYAQTYMKHGKTISQSKAAVEKAYNAVGEKYGKEVLDQLKKYHEKNLQMEGYDDEEFDSNRFARKGSALYPETRTNRRIFPCPNCGTENVLTARDKAKGYQCDNCADAEEFGYGP